MNMSSGITEWLSAFIGLVNSTLIPVLIAAAVLFFIWNIFRYFILQSGSEDGREKAKRSAMYGILALVIILGIWGIIAILIATFDIGRDNQVVPDYIDRGSIGG